MSAEENRLQRFSGTFRIYTLPLARKTSPKRSYTLEKSGYLRSLHFKSGYAPCAKTSSQLLTFKADDRDPDNTALSLFDAGNFGLPSKEYYKDSKVVTNYIKATGDYLHGL